MIFPDTFEHKIGFDHVRRDVRELCVSSLGERLLDDMRFSADYDVVSQSLTQVHEMAGLIAAGDDMPLDDVRDVTRQIKSLRVPGTWLPAAELLSVGRSLGAVGEIVDFMSRHRDEDGESQIPALQQVTASLMPLPQCVAAINRIMDRYGNILDNASPELADIRHRLQRLQASMANIMRRVISQAVQEGVLDSDVTPAMRDGRLVIPVAPMNKRRVPGIIHDESATGKTVFIEPSQVVEANNNIRELQNDERREINRILVMTADLLRPHIDDMLAALDIAAELDFIHAKALYAREVEGMMPTLHRGPYLDWFHVCHPVLLQSLARQGRQIVPLDINLNERDRLLIISGPNAGGKSVVLKTVGCLQYMIQCGMLPPLYDNSHAGIFDDIMVDIGDDQSIENDLSTYSSHLRSMKTLVNSGKPTSLVLIDEMGSGTDPTMGGAIAQATLHAFNDKKMWGIVTTHYQNIKHFAEDTEGLINGSMLYDRHLMQPTFTLSIGNAGSSFAMEIARKIGLPASIISEAEQIVGSDYIDVDKYLLDIARDKRYWENKRTSIKAKEKKLEATLERYEEEAANLRQQRRVILDEARHQASEILQGSNAAIERAIHDIRKAQADKEATMAARRRLADEKLSLSRDESMPSSSNAALRKAPKKSKKKPSAPVAPVKREEVHEGDNVRLDGSTTVGKVLQIQGTQALVAFGMLKTTVDVARLRPTIAKVQSGAGKASFISASTTDSLRNRQLDFKQEIDVRGMRADEALQAVTYFIDDAIQFSAQRVRILHGTGTGALRQCIRDYLATVRGVASYHDEDVRFGGAGITVVNLA